MIYFEKLLFVAEVTFNERKPSTIVAKLSVIDVCGVPGSASVFLQRLLAGFLCHSVKAAVQMYSTE